NSVKSNEDLDDSIQELHFRRRMALCGLRVRSARAPSGAFQSDSDSDTVDRENAVATRRFDVWNEPRRDGPVRLQPQPVSVRHEPYDGYDAEGPHGWDGDARLAPDGSRRGTAPLQPAGWAIRRQRDRIEQLEHDPCSEDARPRAVEPHDDELSRACDVREARVARALSD